MKSLLLRKKAPSENHQKSPPPPPVQHAKQYSPIETPLYSRFATAKSGLPPQESVRPVVSGPMPLARPNRANFDAEENRRRQPQERSIDAPPQGTLFAAQPLSGSPPRNVHSPTDKPRHFAHVSSIQVSRQDIKAQTSCKFMPLFCPCAETCSPVPEGTTRFENVQAFEQGRDFIP
jgi:hypothetical protein